MPKLAWASLPLLLYGLYLIGVLLVRRQAPPRHALNMHISLLLMCYLATTAALGIFWVANQQLPVFDWHYLFGYGTVALLAVHLYFNLPMVWRALRRPAVPAPSAAKGARFGWPLAFIAAVGAAYLLGVTQQNIAPPSTSSADPGRAAVLRFHEHSSESRHAAFARAPALDWGAAPADFKAYPERPHIALARGSVGQRGLSEALRGVGQPARQLALAELGDLLHLSAGVTARRGGKALRAAPSSGALFSGELYVLARTVQGLAPGIYHYDADRHRLAALGPLNPANGLPSAGDADAAIVLTSVVQRTAYKYKHRAYRYLTADAGHLLENLRVASQSAGLLPTLARNFDERMLARTLGVDGVQEIVLAAMELRRGQTALPLPGMAVQADQQSRATVRRVIEQRRSERRFTGDAVRLEVLASMLADMNQADQLSSAVRINLVVNRVQGLAPGIYRYERGHALRLVRRGDFAAAAESAALSQAVIGDAAVVLVLSVDRASVLAEGARGYRHGFIETGLIGERWLLGAVARGLAACPVGAFYDDEAAALIHIDPQREWVLHFAALGVSAKPE